MKETTIVFLTGTLATVLLVVFQDADFFTRSANGRYYFTVFLMINILIAVTTLFLLLRHIVAGNTSTTNHTDISDDRPKNARQTYRIPYTQPPYPIFIEKTDASDTLSAFTCPVIDVSEEGLRLDCVGVYAMGQTVQGEIIFNSGRTAPANGVVIREKDNYTALRLHCTIDPSTLIAEQRERILRQKDDSSLPVINPLFKTDTWQPLPSHQPKNVCRIKPS